MLAGKSKNKLFATVAMLFISFVISFSAFSVSTEAATTSLQKTSITSCTQTGKKAVKVSWSKSPGAKGYQLQYRVSGGSWKTKNVTNRSTTVSKLSVGKTYQFRVRAYKAVSGKKKYSRWSVTKKIKLRSYVYLTSNYASYNYTHYLYSCYPHGVYFMMGGKERTNGIVLKGNYGYVKANYNIEGKYSSISFCVGTVDGGDSSATYSLNVYSDGTLARSVEIKCDELPQNVTIPLDQTERLTFETKTWNESIGIADIKLFY